MIRFHSAFGCLALAGLVASAAGCGSDALDPSSSGSTVSGSPEASAVAQGNLSALAASLRVRCERRSGRSKISVDANNVSPRGGRFRARVQAAGGTVTSGLKRAVGDEVEFDFDSNRNDIAQGATRVPASFIQRRSGPDVVGLLLNSQGTVVARQGVECSFR